MTSSLKIRNCVFSFRCDARWEDMEQECTDDFIDNENIRFCSKCQKEVFLSLTDEELVKNVRLNRCVAIIRYEKGIVNTTAGMIE